MGKRRVYKFPEEYRKMALERLKSCESVTALSKELGIHRGLLYRWRNRREPSEEGPGPPAASRERGLRQEIRALKRLLGNKMLEVDFFKGAFEKVEARRHGSGSCGEKASTTKSGSRCRCKAD